jgi:NAD(P)-dependent dehydrogenase (short-subunit alcohol dehydrogenase family)
MTNEDDVKNMVDKTIAEFGRLDILVNNAGILELGSIENTTLEQYDRVMNVNLRYSKT